MAGSLSQQNLTLRLPGFSEERKKSGVENVSN